MDPPTPRPELFLPTRSDPATDDPLLGPVELVRPGLIGDPVLVGVPERARLDDHDPPALPGQALRQHRPAGARADDEQVDLVVVAVATPSCPGRAGRAMDVEEVAGVVGARADRPLSSPRAAGRSSGPDPRSARTGIFAVLPHARAARRCRAEAHVPLWVRRPAVADLVPCPRMGVERGQDRRMHTENARVTFSSSHTPPLRFPSAKAPTIASLGPGAGRERLLAVRCAATSSSPRSISRQVSWSAACRRTGSRRAARRPASRPPSRPPGPRLTRPGPAATSQNARRVGSSSVSKNLIGPGVRVERATTPGSRDPSYRRSSRTS